MTKHLQKECRKGEFTMNKRKEIALKLKEICVNETSRAKVREFFLYSKKVYAVLGIGIMMCVLQLTTNIAYGMGEKKAELYNDRYVKTYTALAENYCNSNPNATVESALNFAEVNCNYFEGDVKDGTYLKWLGVEE